MVYVHATCMTLQDQFQDLCSAAMMDQIQGHKCKNYYSYKTLQVTQSQCVYSSLIWNHMWASSWYLYAVEKFSAKIPVPL